MKNEKVTNALLADLGTRPGGEEPLALKKPHVLHNPAKLITRDARGRVRVRSINDERTQTQQHHKDACDVNKIVAKYKTTGEWLHLAKTDPFYADISEITDYQQSLHKVMAANDAFMTLPSNVRLRFGNDPGQLLAFMQDPKNHAEGVELGLYEKPQAQMAPPTTTIQTTTTGAQNPPETQSEKK